DTGVLGDGVGGEDAVAVHGRSAALDAGRPPATCRPAPIVARRADVRQYGVRVLMASPLMQTCLRGEPFAQTSPFPLSSTPISTLISPAPETSTRPLEPFDATPSLERNVPP